MATRQPIAALLYALRESSLLAPPDKAILLFVLLMLFIVLTAVFRPRLIARCKVVLGPTSQIAGPWDLYHNPVSTTISLDMPDALTSKQC